MRAGVVVAAKAGVEELAVQAEELGLSSFWVYDTPMVHGDPFVALALCAKATSRIKLGVGVTSPALRSVPAAASALMSLNALAPGRIICGVGTGNSARRTVGMPPTKGATLEAFTTGLQDLCAGRSTSYREDDRVRDIRLLHVEPHPAPIEFVVGTQGPRSAAIAGRRGTGLISFAILDPAAWQAFHDARRNAANTPLQGSYLMTSLYILDEGEDPYSDAARDATGHTILSFLTFAADNPSITEMLSPQERTAVQQFLTQRGTTSTTPDRYQPLYTNYLGRITPTERDLILPSLLEKLALVGTPESLQARLTALHTAGVDEFLIQPVVDPPTEIAALASLITPDRPAVGDTPRERSR